MRIVIDLQGAQGASRYRGIGRYTLSLAKAMVRNRGNHEIIIALNGMFPDSIEPIRAAFDGLLSQDNIRVWHANGPVHPMDPANAWRRHTAELIREDFLAGLQPDIVHITSLFEGFGDNAVHSVGSIPARLPTAVTLYDLIPLIESEKYLKPNPTYEKFYREKLEYLKQVDLYLSISESSRQEVIDHLGVPAEQTANIAAAADDNFKPIHISNDEKHALFTRVGLDRPFVMYSGATDERKNHLRLIKAFSLLPSELRKNHQLAIVGRLPDDHKEKFEIYAKLCGLKADEVVVTGLVTDEDLVQLYNLCSLFVFPSIHEGFGLPALEAMCCGAPVIGANTSSVPEVIGRTEALFDPFDEKAICQKMAEVLTNDRFRDDLARHGLEQARQFSWDESANIAIAAMENWHANKQSILEPHAQPNVHAESWLIEKIATLANPPIDEIEWINTAQALSQNRHRSTEKKLLIDISELANRDAKSGVQRVVRSVLAELLANPPLGFKTVPVYAVPGKPGYYEARQFTQKFLNLPENSLEDFPVEASNGDIFLGLDLQHHIVLQSEEFYAHLRRVGAKVYFVVYDLLPVLLPKVFPGGLEPIHAQWLAALAKNDGVLCISRAVADEMKEWLDVFGPKRLSPLKIGWFHLGADMAGSVPSKGLPANASNALQSFALRPTFLMVGTVEPRKGQLQTLLAFEELWNKDVDVNLVIIGKHGWNVDLLVSMLRSHSECNRRLFWLEGVSDEYLEKIYATSSCLIAASEGEGFGLPLIEAAQKKLPIIARDIPVFREVAGENAFYFSGLSPTALAESVQAWLALDKVGKAPQSDDMPWLTWKQSTQNLQNIMLRGDWYQEWMPDDVLRFWGGDSRLGTQVGKRMGRDIVSTSKAGYLIFGPYVPLACGKYRVVIRGKVGANGIADAHMDVVADKGKLVLCESALKGTDETGELASLFISLDTPCTDLEIRLWVGADTDLEVSLVEIAPWKPTDVYKYWGGEKRLNTQVGQRTSQGMSTTGQAGCLLFGPYLPLAAGKYRVVVHGALGQGGAAGANMDVVADSSKLMLGQSLIVKSVENDNLASLMISLDAACTDLEVRTWVSNDTELTISMIEIIPCLDEQKTSHVGPGNPTLKDSLQQDASPPETTQQEQAQVLQFVPKSDQHADEVTQDEIPLQELVNGAPRPHAAITAPSSKSAHHGNETLAMPMMEPPVSGLTIRQPEASNTTSAVNEMSLTPVSRNGTESSNTERNRAKAKRKKKR